MSSVPPTSPAERLYGLVRLRHRCGRVKPIPRKVSQTHKVEITYQMSASMAKPRGYPSKRCYGAHRTCRQCSRIKIVPRKLKIEHINNKTAQNGKMTYLGHGNAMQPPVVDSVHAYVVIGPKHQCSRIKIESTNVNRMGTNGNTYQK